MEKTTAAKSLSSNGATGSPAASIEAEYRLTCCRMSDACRWAYPLRTFQNNGNGLRTIPVTLLRRAMGWKYWPSG